MWPKYLKTVCAALILTACGFTNVPDPGTMTDESSGRGGEFADAAPPSVTAYDAGTDDNQTQRDGVDSDGAMELGGSRNCPGAAMPDGGSADLGDGSDGAMLYADGSLGSDTSMDDDPCGDAGINP